MEDRDLPSNIRGKLWRNPFAHDPWVPPSRSLKPSWHVHNSTSLYNRNILSLTHLKFQTKQRHGISCATWFPAGRKALVAPWSGELLIYHPEESDDIKRLPHSVGSLTTLSWTADQALLLIGDSGGQIHFTSPALTPLNIIQLRDTSLEDAYKSGFVKNGQGSPVVAVSPAPSSLKLAAVGEQMVPKIYDITTQRAERAFDVAGFDVTCMEWHPREAWVMVGKGSEQIQVVDPRQGNLVASVVAHKSAVSTLHLTEGFTAITGGRDRVARLFDIRYLQQPFREIGNLPGVPTRFACHPLYPSRFLLLGDSLGDVHYFDFATLPSDERQYDSLGPYHIFSLSMNDGTGRGTFGIVSLEFHSRAPLLLVASQNGNCSFWGSAS